MDHVDNIIFLNSIKELQQKPTEIQLLWMLAVKFHLYIFL